MSYLDTTDHIVAALQALLFPAVNKDLLSELSVTPPAVQAVSATYGFPIPLRMVPVLHLPALSIFRGVSRWEQRGKHELRLTEFHIDYVGPQSPMGSVHLIWPLLHRVFESLAKNLEGWHDDDAGVVEVYHRDARVTYNFTSDKEHLNVYPMFSSVWSVLHCPRIPDHTPIVGVPFTLDLAISKGPFRVDITTPEETP